MWSPNAFKRLLVLNLILLKRCAATDYYFDGIASDNGIGTSSSPFNSLSIVRSMEIAPGDNILLKRGSNFSEPLILSTSGLAGSPITIGAYGDVLTRSPVISPNTESLELNAILLNGTSNVVVQDLEISNPGNSDLPCRGVYVYAENSGEVHGITLQRLYIHDVRGWMPSTTGTGAGIGKYANASGGIVFEAAGNQTPTYFSQITVQDNILRSVDREGFYTWTNWCRRPALAAFWYALCFETWYPSTGLVVQRNHLYDIGGDGIVVHGHENAKVQNNTLIGFNKRADSPNAGMWTANSDGSHFQFNYVTGGNTTKDGMAYDVDHSTSGTVFEYNVSHDNQGGFFLICPYNTPTQNFTIRDNLSVNDRTRIIQICDGQVINGSFYKNTIYIGDGLSPYIVTESTEASLDFLFADNIIRKDGSGTAQWKLNNSAFSVKDNSFYGSIDAYSASTDNLTSAPELAAPGLRDPNAYLLLVGSPALGSALDVPGDTSVDFFGNIGTVPGNLGFYGGGGTKAPVWISNFDQESDLSPWDLQGNVSLVLDPAGDLGKSVRLSSTSTISRLIRATAPFRLDMRIWVVPHDNENEEAGYPNVQIGGTTSAAVFSNSSQYIADQWQILELYVLEGVDSLGQQAILDGNSFTLTETNDASNSTSITINSGNTTIYIDDTFLTPL